MCESVSSALKKIHSLFRFEGWCSLTHFKPFDDMSWLLIILFLIILIMQININNKMNTWLLRIYRKNKKLFMIQIKFPKVSFNRDIESLILVYQGKSTTNLCLNHSISRIILATLLNKLREANAIKLLGIHCVGNIFTLFNSIQWYTRWTIGYARLNLSLKSLFQVPAQDCIIADPLKSIIA